MQQKAPTKTPGQAATQFAIKIVKEYERDGETKQSFRTIGWLRAAKEGGKIAFYVDLEMFDSTFVVFREDKDEADGSGGRPIKIIKHYEDSQGEEKQSFRSVGALREGKQGGKVQYYIDFDMFDSRYLVFRGDRDESDEVEQ